MKGRNESVREYLTASAEQTPCVWVVGDAMLDEYWEGQALLNPREHRGAVKVDILRSFPLLGGAANAAAGIAALGAGVLMASVVGHDAAGEQLVSLCRHHGIGTRGVLVVDDRRTTRKVRLIIDEVQTMRLDHETRKDIAVKEAELLTIQLSTGPWPDAIVVSDYAKGVVIAPLIAPILYEARKRAIPVIVDSKASNLEFFRGASWLTPNVNELALTHGTALAGASLSKIESAARGLIQRLELNGVVVTLSARGMLFLPAADAAVHLPSDARYVTETAGAGDSVTAAFAVGLALRLEPLVAARVASLVAGRAVEAPRTATVARAIIEAALRDA